MRVEAVGAGSPPTRKEGDVGLGDQYFEILINQLRYQDPLEPIKNGEFISQMAQLASLRELEQINLALRSIESVLGGSQRG